MPFTSALCRRSKSWLPWTPSSDGSGFTSVTSTVGFLADSSVRGDRNSRVNDGWLAHQFRSRNSVLTGNAPAPKHFAGTKTFYQRFARSIGEIKLQELEYDCEMRSPD